MQGDVVSVQEKYDFLLNYIKVRDKDYYEGDATLCMDNIYFQFGSADNLSDMDACVELAANDWYRSLK